MAPSIWQRHQVSVKRKSRKSVFPYHQITELTWKIKISSNCPLHLTWIRHVQVRMKCLKTNIKLIPLQVFFNTWRYEFSYLTLFPPWSTYLAVLLYTLNIGSSPLDIPLVYNREDKTRNPQASSMQCLPLHSQKRKTLLVREWIFLKEQSAVLLLLSGSSIAQVICYNGVRLHTTRS